MGGALPWETPLDTARRKYYEQMQAREEAEREQRWRQDFAARLYGQRVNNEIGGMNLQLDLAQARQRMNQPVNSVTNQYRRLIGY